MDSPAQGVARARIQRSAAILLCAAAASCAGVSYRDGVVHSQYTTYRVGRLGADWQQVSVDDNDLAFFSRGKGTIGAHSTCSDYDDVPQTALMNHLLFGTQKRVFRVEEEVTLDGRGARHVVVDAELDGVPITLEVVLVVKNGCVYDLSLVSSRERHARARDEFMRFVGAFEVLPHGD